MISKKNRFIVSKFQDYLILERGYSIHTVQAYQADLKKIEIFLRKLFDTNDFDLKLVKRDNIQRFLADEFDKGRDPKSISRYLASIKSFFRYLTEIKEIKYNPALMIESPKISSSLPIYVGKEKLEKIIKNLEKNSSIDNGDRDLAIFELFYITGIRLAEFLLSK